MPAVHSMEKGLGSSVDGGTARAPASPTRQTALHWPHWRCWRISNPPRFSNRTFSLP